MISSHSVWNDNQPKLDEPSVEAIERAASVGHCLGVPAASANNWASQQRFKSTNHHAASSIVFPVVKIPWPPWMATRLSPNAAANFAASSAARTIRCSLMSACCSKKVQASCVIGSSKRSSDDQAD